MSSSNSKQRLLLRGLAVNLLLCIAAVSLTFGGAEVLARLKYTPQKFEPYGIFEYDKEKTFRLEKNQFATFHNVPFTTNSLGFRGEEITVKKPEHTKRILVLGDSISFGHGVRDNETYSFLLQQSLNEQAGEQRFEVINTAAPMNSPFQEYFDLKREIRLLPDLIVLQLTLNDVYDMPLVDVIELRQHLDYLFRQHSAFYLFITDMISRIRFRDISGENITEKAQQKEIVEVSKLILEPDDPEVKQAWADALQWTRKILETAEDVPVLILVTPFDFQLGIPPQYAFPQHTFRTFAQEEKAHFIDMLEILQDIPVQQVLRGEEEGNTIKELLEAGDGDSSEYIEKFWNAFFLDYDHPSPTGHKLIADMLQAYISQKLPELLKE